MGIKTMTEEHTKPCLYYKEKNGRCNCKTAGKMTTNEKTYVLIEGLLYEMDKDGKLIKRE